MFRIFAWLVREFREFDEIINGKEATTYLSHIVRNYDSLADVTLFMHSNPTHHLEYQLFYKVFAYILSCRHQLDYISLNFRYFGGPWAHEPVDCLYKLMPALFANSSELSDYKRFPFGRDREYNMAAFLKLEMSGSTAAQFLAGKDAILRRPLTFWEKLMALNNGSVPICGTETSDKWGGDVTGAM